MPRTKPKEARRNLRAKKRRDASRPRLRELRLLAAAATPAAPPAAPAS